jgi:transcription termination factor Rho
MPILFDEDDSPKKKTRVSKKNKMQSEEDWTPQALPEEAQPAVEPASQEEGKPKAKRAPRSRKPRAPKAKPAEGNAGAAVDAPPPAATEPPPERQQPPPERPESQDRQRPDRAERERPAPQDRQRPDRTERERPEPQERQRPERQERAEQAREAAPGNANSESPAPRADGPASETREERPGGDDRDEAGRNRDRDQDRRPRHEHPGGSGRRDRDERHPQRHHGGGGGSGGGGGNPNERRGDRHGDNFRNKKKKKKGGRFDRPGGGGGGHPHVHSGGGGGGGGAHHRTADLPDAGRFQDLEELERLAAEATGDPLEMGPLYEISLHDLVEAARAMGVVLDAAPNRRLLISRMLEKALEDKRPIIDRGILNVTDAGFGFVTRHAYNYRTQPEDTFVAPGFIRRFGLKAGHFVEVQVKPPENGERCPSVLRVNKVMDLEPEKVADIVPFEDLVPYYPLQRILLEVQKEEPVKDVSMRAVDLLTPIGFGQRGLIVAPPRTGKTVILQQIANSIATNNPQAHLIVLLIDERPEEVTDFRRNVRGEVVSSTFDEPADSHVEVAEMVIEKARRMVEAGRDVVILLDSITRLARAYNAMMPSSGKILSGGVEANALQKPKRFFGAARNIEGGGSLTILATALIDTGSRMDEVIFEEFKGTGNMELHLDRALVDKRIFPALNIEKSGTRKEELLYHPEEMNRIYALRRAIQGVPMVEAMEMLVQRLKKTKSNAEFLMGMNR